MAERRLLFLVNKKAGKSAIKTHLLDIIDIFIKAKFSVNVHTTQFSGEIAQILPECACDYDIVVCSGGDGTLNETVTGLINSGVDIPLGYIPAGTVNDFAHSLNISRDNVRAAEDIITGDEFGCDIGCLNGRNFVYVAAFGAFTEVSYQTPQQSKNLFGRNAYIFEGVKRVSDIKSYHVKVECNGELIEDEFIFGMVSNSTSIGGFSLHDSYISMNDGELEVVLIRRPKNMFELQGTIGAILARDISSKYLCTFRAKQINISCDEGFEWTLDGEFGGAFKQTEIFVKEKAVKIIVPKTESDR